MRLPNPTLFYGLNISPSLLPECEIEITGAPQKNLWVMALYLHPRETAQASDLGKGVSAKP